jgi:hypothetical protein
MSHSRWVWRLTLHRPQLLTTAPAQQSPSSRDGAGEGRAEEEEVSGGGREREVGGEDMDLRAALNSNGQKLFTRANSFTGLQHHYIAPAHAGRQASRRRGPRVEKTLLIS